jgi:hypothetical protein
VTNPRQQAYRRRRKLCYSRNSLDPGHFKPKLLGKLTDGHPHPDSANKSADRRIA